MADILSTGSLSPEATKELVDFLNQNGIHCEFLNILKWKDREGVAIKWKHCFLKYLVIGFNSHDLLLSVWYNQHRIGFISLTESQCVLLLLSSNWT